MVAFRCSAFCVPCRRPSACRVLRPHSGGTKAVLVIDPGLPVAGWEQEVCRALEVWAIPRDLAAEVSPMLRTRGVAAGADRFWVVGCEVVVVVVVGGGRMLDCAKGMALMTESRRRFASRDGVTEIDRSGPPLRLHGQRAFGDLWALEAIRLIRVSLKRTWADPPDETARTAMMLTSLLAGLVFSNPSLGAVHAMAHSRDGGHDLAHGDGIAILLPHVIAFKSWRDIGPPLPCDRGDRT